MRRHPQSQSRRSHVARAAGLCLTLFALTLSACGDSEKASSSATGGEQQVLRVGVGPLLPTPEETKKAWTPFFTWLSGELGMKYELSATTDWAGISVAMRNDQLDLAWMGPFGYVLANTEGGAKAIATAKYDEKPIYHAIVVSRPGLGIKKWPEDGKGKSISFTDSGSTSGWLIPTNWFRERKIDPKKYFEYSEGATHSANEIAIANGRVDLATDFDRNRNAMIESGAIKEQDSEIVWRSDPLPNDAIAIKPDTDPALEARIKKALLGLTPEDAAKILPEHYTGFVDGSDKTYAPIREAGQAVGVLEK